ERLVFFFPVAKIRVGNGAGRKVGLALMERHELLRLRKGQRIEQHAVDYRKERGVGSDAKRERHYYHGGGTGLLHQHSRAKAQVLKHFVLQSSHLAVQSSGSPAIWQSSHFGCCLGCESSRITATLRHADQLCIDKGGDFV